jgi:hypothetical protein
LPGKNRGIDNLARFKLEDILTVELLIEHILIGFTKFKRETLFNIVCTPNLYLNLNVDLGVEGVFCSTWKLNLPRTGGNHHHA